MGFHKFPKNRQKIAGVVVFNTQDEVLILKKGRKWDLPKGHVEPGETFLEGALRECYEETGLDYRENLNIHPFHYVSLPSKKWLRFYLGFADDEIELSDEHESYQWVSIDEAVRLFGCDNHFSHIIQMLSIPAASCKPRRRNPEKISHGICRKCYIENTGKEPQGKETNSGDVKVVCGWCQKVIYDPKRPKERRLRRRSSR